MKKCKNRVSIEGYLKENTLTIGKDKNGAEIVSGYVTLSCQENSEFKVQYYCKRYNNMKPGQQVPDENKFYNQLAAMTAEKTTSFKKILDIDPNATFETCKRSCTKISAFGSIQEDYYKSKTTGDVVCRPKIRGTGGKILEGGDISPRAIFKVKVYIDSIRPEMKEGEETGRLEVVGLYPEYDGSVSEFKFFTGDEVATEHISSNYEKGMTSTLEGDLYSAVKKTLVSKASSSSFGRAAKDSYSYDFVQEFLIFGGDSKTEEDEDSIKRDEIVEARVKREEKIQKAANGDSSSAAPSSNRGFTAPASPSNKPFSF